MDTESHDLTINGLPVTIVRKAIKNLHLGVYPPNGRVRVAAPLAVTDEAVRLAVVGKLGWIKRQQAKFKAQPRQSAREMVRGESHYFLGVRYRLRIVEQAESPRSCYATNPRWTFMCARAPAPSSANGYCKGGIADNSKN
jgi:predicted metal-dependent hydrolase